LPAGVKVSLSGATVRVEGPKGKLEHVLGAGITAKLDEQKREMVVSRSSNSKPQRMQHGLHRAMVMNMVIGVTEGYKKELEIIGIGYNVRLEGGSLSLDVGFANTIKLPVPKGVIVEVTQATNPGKLVVSGINKHDVGQFAASARAVRPPEPYQGKGVRYLGEAVRRKAGKSMVGAG
jgi:large subunit ribosomal protein L6